MKKNLIAMGVAAALTAPMAAQAMDAGDGSNVELYGRFQAEWTNVSSDLEGSNEPLYLNDMDAGKWGIFASEKLGNGWTAFGRFEWDEHVTDSKDSDRAQYLGVSGDWGLFLVGRHDTPYKITGGVKADPFTATNLEARRGGGMSSGVFGQGSYADHVFAYASPDFNGFSFIAAINPENSDGSVYGKDGANLYSIGAQYKNGPVWVWAGYNDGQDLQVLGEDIKAWKVGGAYTFGNHSIRAQYEDRDGVSTGVGSSSVLGSLYGEIDSESADFLWVAYVLTMGNNELMVSYGDENYDNVDGYSDDAEVQSYTVAARHNMSKTFNVFGGWKRYSVDDGDNTDDTDVITVGMRKDFKI